MTAVTAKTLPEIVLASPLGRELTPAEAEALASIASLRDLKDGEVDPKSKKVLQDNPVRLYGLEL